MSPHPSCTVICGRLFPGSRQVVTSIVVRAPATPGNRPRWDGLVGSTDVWGATPFQVKRFLIIKSGTELGGLGPQGVAETAVSCHEVTPAPCACFGHRRRAEGDPVGQDGAPGAVTSEASAAEGGPRALKFPPSCPPPSEEYTRPPFACGRGHQCALSSEMSVDRCHHGLDSLHGQTRALPLLARGMGRRPAG